MDLGWTCVWPITHPLTQTLAKGDPPRWTRTVEGRALSDHCSGKQTPKGLCSTSLGFRGWGSGWGASLHLFPTPPLGSMAPPQLSKLTYCWTRITSQWQLSIHVQRKGGEADWGAPGNRPALTEESGLLRSSGSPRRAPAPKTPRLLAGQYQEAVQGWAVGHLGHLGYDSATGWLADLVIAQEA